jgi:hypothetical protein
MTAPNYLLTFKRAVREQEERAARERARGELSELCEISTPLNSLNSLNSRLARAARECGKHEINELNEITPPLNSLNSFNSYLAELEQRCPDYVDQVHWNQAVEDGRRFLATWGSRAEALGWTPAEVFGLPNPPSNPHPSYNRLSRYDDKGLVWLLEGNKSVVALSSNTAAVQHKTGAVTNYRKHNKPALGPLGDSLDDNQA